MSLILRNRLTRFGLVICIVTVSALQLVLLVGVGTADEQEPSTTTQTPESHPDAMPIDEHTSSQLQALREELCLTDMDLAAMGMSGEGAAGLLRILTNWYQQNHAALDQSEQDILKTRSSVREIWRQINLGPRDSNVIASLPWVESQAADAARHRNEVVLAAAIEAISAPLTQDQVTIWETARSNIEAPGEYRYVPDLTTEQIKRIRAERHNSARRGNPLQSSAVLNSYQQMSKEAARLRIQMHIEDVAAASDQAWQIVTAE